MNLIRFIVTFAPNGWWRRFPFLPLPPWEYVKFRQETMYGRKGIRVLPRMLYDLPRFYRAWVAWNAHLKAERLWRKAVPVERCLAPAGQGTRCVLAKGHNVGNVDIPENHRGVVYFSIGGLEFRRVQSGIVAAVKNEAHGDIGWLDEDATGRLIAWLEEQWQ